MDEHLMSVKRITTAKTIEGENEMCLRNGFHQKI